MVVLPVSAVFFVIEFVPKELNSLGASEHKYFVPPKYHVTKFEVSNLFILIYPYIFDLGFQKSTLPVENMHLIIVIILNIEAFKREVFQCATTDSKTLKLPSSTSINIIYEMIVH